MKRFIAMHKSDPRIEAGALPCMELLTHMGALMQEMAAAGVMESGEGLRPTSEGARVRFSQGTRTVTHGPFHGSNELVGNLAMVRVGSIDEAIEWTTRIARIVGDSDYYIGRVTEMWDLGLAPKPEGQGTRYLIFKQGEPGIDPEPVIEEMRRAGVLVAAERLEPSATGVRLKLRKDKRSVTDGPFTESKELIAGYCIMRVATRDDMLPWITRFAEVIREFAPADEVEVDIRGLA